MISAEKTQPFALGDHVVYPLQGVGIVKKIEEKTLRGVTSMYYEIYLDISDMTVMVPISKTLELGIRPIVPPAEAMDALSSITHKLEQVPIDWKARYQMNVDLLTEGSIASIARVVQILYHRSKIKELPVQERKLYDSALRILIDETSLALDRPREELEALIFGKLESGGQAKKGCIVSFPSHAVIVTAAGLSERFQSSQEGHGNKKEYILLDDRTVLYHAVLPFLSVPSLKAIIVTYPDMFRDECESALDNLIFASQIPIHLVVGGSTRQKSVCNALKFIDDAHLDISFVAIHDGARPFVTEPLIIETLATASIFGAAVPAIPIHDALKHISKEGIIDGHVDRTALVQIQTPQVFHFPEIFNAHQMVAESNKLYVDDSEIYNDAGFEVAISKGNISNIKITTYDDIANYKREYENWYWLGYPPFSRR